MKQIAYLIGLLPALALGAQEPVLHIFYLHGAIIETQGKRPTHPRFGTYEYQDVLDALAGSSRQVHSEARPPHTEVKAYAQKTVDKIRGLLDEGVAPENITVVGFSKGGAMAIFTSSILGDDRVGFVFLAACGGWIEQTPELVPRGRLLSIRETSDDLVGSCDPLFARAPEGTQHKEVTLDLGNGHGAFYKPDPAWIKPVLEWAANQP